MHMNLACSPIINVVYKYKSTRNHLLISLTDLCLDNQLILGGTHEIIQHFQRTGKMNVNLLIF
jgi:hypothetical protein